ncbi:transposase [Enterobacter hormaechei]|nr:transposase [Enterobacter hormaechei]
MPVLASDRKNTKTGRIWSYVRDDRNASSPDLSAAWFVYSPDRQGTHPEPPLRPFRSIRQTDVFTGYDRLLNARR